MQRLRLSALTLALVMLAACGGSQTGVVPQNATTLAMAHQSGKSWMLPEASGEDLIYAVNGCDGTCVISYPDGKLVGSLVTYDGYGSGDCVDSAGNVYIADDMAVVEYAHGGTVPINTFNLPGYDPEGCSVDPMTGNLAVVFNSVPADIAIFPKGQSTPETYGAAISATACAYDSQGNLFVSGYDGERAGLSELPVGGSKFSVIQIGNTIGRPGQVQWDGKYLAYQDTYQQRASIIDLSISGSKATIVKKIRLKRINRNSYLSWISNGIILVPYSRRGLRANRIGVWNYPKAKKPFQTFVRVTADPNFQSVALSPAPSD